MWAARFWGIGQGSSNKNRVRFSCHADLNGKCYSFDILWIKGQKGTEELPTKPFASGRNNQCGHLHQGTTAAESAAKVSIAKYAICNQPRHTLKIVCVYVVHICRFFFCSLDVTRVQLKIVRIRKRKENNKLTRIKRRHPMRLKGQSSKVKSFTHSSTTTYPTKWKMSKIYATCIK